MTQVHLFAGTAGVDKRGALARFGEYLCNHQEIPDIRRAQHVKVYDLQDFQEYRDASLFLGLHPSVQQRYLFDAWNRLRESVTADNPSIALVSFHGTFFRDHQTRFMHPWQEIASLNPLSITVLIDDIYHVWKRIELRNEADDTFSHYSLGELLSWRTLEYEFAACLARNLFPAGNTIPVWLFAVKHYNETLRKLLFEPDVPRCYLSYPITNIRHDPAIRSVIDTMRSRVSQVVTAFDPLTIDEMILAFEHRRLLADGDAEGNIDTLAHLRWPILDPEDRLSVFPADIPISIPRRDVVDVMGRPLRARTPIEDHVRSRDFLLCTQGQFLAIYRPNFNEKLSFGATAEAHFATNAEPRRKFTYWPSDDGPYTGAFFTDFGVLSETEEKWYSAISTFKP